MSQILVGKYPKNFIEDGFLSGILGREVHRVVLDPVLINYPGITNVYRLHENAFFYAKVAVDDIAGITYLQQHGFSLIDTNVTFEKAVEAKAVASQDGAVRLAKSEDKEKVKALAGSCFRYSRFHLDPLVKPEIANRIKAEWVGNFFEGKRGQAMIVAEKAGATVGFLQLLDDKNGTITIDLIGVDEKARKQGVAAAMINFAQAQFSKAAKIVVGTQIANIPSLRCYEKLGFKIKQSAYVFHYHG